MNSFDFVDNLDLLRRLEFIVEIDKMKTVLRRTLLADGSRCENDAEHSWHLAMIAMVLENYAAEKADMTKVIRMALVHDLVEVYAGDTFAYDEEGNLSKLQRETDAADKLFALLPSPTGEELRALWEEFDEAETPEARFACAVDRLQPLISNYLTNGHTWRGGAVNSRQVLKRMEPIREAIPGAWAVVEGIIAESIKKGILAP